MLSFPLIPPQPDILPGRVHLRPRAESPPSIGRYQQHGPHHQHHHQPHRNPYPHRHNDSQRPPPPRTPNPLALLTADESAIAARKAAIRNFGAYWIRPPGVSKTLQAMTEEAAELAEQEELLRQEQGLRDLQARQQVEEARARAAEMGEGGVDGEGVGVGEDGEGGEERDLDDEIPDADADAGEDEEEEEVTFNEDSMVEGSRVEDQEEQRYAALEEAELTGAARDEEDLGIEHERDLDDSVPEAGSYQHTDTEVEDSTEDDDGGSSPLQDSFAGAAPRLQPSSSARQPNTRSSDRSQPQTQRSQRRRLPFETVDNAVVAEGSLQDRMRAAAAADSALARSPGSLNLSSSILESSFVGSSPVMQRGARGRGGRGRMS